VDLIAPTVTDESTVAMIEAAITAVVLKPEIIHVRHEPAREKMAKIPRISSAAVAMMAIM